MGSDGQFVCVRSSIRHLREAMPFDQIVVTMKLARLYERGLELYFEYYKAVPDGPREKLAYGTHTLAWAKVDDEDDYVPMPIPEAYVTEILNEKYRIHGLS